MSQNKKIILGISCGDFNGVGLEILIKAFSNTTLFDLVTPILYCPLKAINFYKKLNQKTEFNYHVIKSAKDASLKQLNVINFHLYTGNSIEHHQGAFGPLFY